MSKPTTKRQALILTALERNGRWHKNCGWHWDGMASTQRALEQLMVRGLVTRDDSLSYPIYRPVQREQA